MWPFLRKTNNKDKSQTQISNNGASEKKTPKTKTPETVSYMQDLEIVILRSARKTISLEMKPNGILQVKAPLRLSQRDIMEHVARHGNWIAKQMERQKIVSEADALTEQELKALKKRARQVFLERTAYFAPLVGVDYGSITVRLQKSRFGSCSRQGNLNYNAALLLAPPEVLDYVVVHELCHRKHMDHSREFWQEVDRVFPGYRSHKNWLKENGSLILARCGVLP